MRTGKVERETCFDTRRNGIRGRGSDDKRGKNEEKALYSNPFLYTIKSKGTQAV